MHKAGGAVISEPEVDKVVLAFKRAIVDKFNSGTWIELGLITQTSSIITDHPRLLRSLKWGDDDYDESVFDVVQAILHSFRGRKYKERVAQFEAFVGLEEWLRTHDSALYADLYDTPSAEGDLVPLDLTQA
jgi:AbiJ-like protein